MFSDTGKDDLLLLYFSGHGLKHTSGELYLALKETRLFQPIGTALSAAFLKEAMNASLSRRQVVILDCCYSGAFARGLKGAQSALSEDTFEVKGYGREVLTSSTATQLSWEGKHVTGDTDRSLFTHYLVEGLETGQAALPGSTEITVEQMYLFAFNKVLKTTSKMKPHRWVDRQEGTFVIAQNPRPAVSLLPEDLREDLKSVRPYLREGAVRELGRLLRGDDRGLARAAEAALRALKETERDRYVYQAVEEQLARIGVPSAPRQPQPPPRHEVAVATLVAGETFRDTLKDGLSGPEMVVIPAGRFLMGSPKGEAERLDWEGPQHDVNFARPFAMGKYTVTFEEFDRFAQATGRTLPDDEGWGRGRRPVINVIWEDATAYVEWLGGETGEAYRLPSEAEWEYAARAGTATPFHFGATISTKQANYDGNYTYGKGRKGKWREQTVEAGSLPANPWGLHEVYGNVWEWVEDCWNDSYEGAPVDGLPGRLEIAAFACCGAARGAADRSGYVRRAVTGATLITGATMLVFASPGLFSPLYFVLLPFA